MTKDLTKGSAFKLMLSFLLPVLAGNLFQQLYNMVDAVIVGRAVSSDAMAGVSSTGSVTFLVLGFALGLTSGFAVKTSQRFGAHDDAGVRKSVATSLQLCLLLTVLLTAVAMPLTAPVLRLMQTPKHYFDYAYWYLLICFAGIGATVLYNISAATLRAVGDTKTPLMILVASAVINIGLNLLFVIPLKMHHTGVALATVISQFISGGGGLWYMMKKYPVLCPNKEDWKIDFSLWKGHIALGLPMALQFSITALGCIFQQSAVNSLNDEMPGVVTAYAAATKINILFDGVFTALGTTVATYVGQNFGAKEYGRIRECVRVGLLYAAVMWAVGMLVNLTLGGVLSGLFFDKNTGDAALYYDEIIAYAKKYLVFQGVFYGLVSIIHVYRNALQGIGYSALAMFGGVTELIGRLVAAFLFVKLWAFTGVCLSNPVSWLLTDLLLVTAYYLVIRKFPAKTADTVINSVTEQTSSEEENNDAL